MAGDHCGGLEGGSGRGEGVRGARGEMEVGRACPRKGKESENRRGNIKCEVEEVVILVYVEGGECPDGCREVCMG